MHKWRAAGAAACVLFTLAVLTARWRHAETGPVALPVIFSHRGRVGPDSSACFSETDLHAALGAGVRAFDLDLFRSADGGLWVGHPVELRQSLGLRGGVWDATGAQLSGACAARRACANTRSCGLLSVDALLSLATALVPNVTLALDLKGSERPHFKPALASLHTSIVRMGLERSVWLWVESTELARWLHRDTTASAEASGSRQDGGGVSGVGGVGGGVGGGEGGGLGRGAGGGAGGGGGGGGAGVGGAARPHHSGRVRMLKPIRDVGARRDVRGLAVCTDQLSPADAVVFSALGPSLRCANGHLLHAPAAAPFRAASHGWLVWVVDEMDELHNLARSGVTAVISNRPVDLAREIRREIQREIEH